MVELRFLLFFTSANKSCFQANKNPRRCQRGNTICAQQSSRWGPAAALTKTGRITFRVCNHNTRRENSGGRIWLTLEVGSDNKKQCERGKKEVKLAGWRDRKWSGGLFSWRDRRIVQQIRFHPVLHSRAFLRPGRAAPAIILLSRKNASARLFL